MTSTSKRPAPAATLLRERGHRLPSRIGVEIEGIRIDLVYDNADVPTVVLVDDGGGDKQDTTPLIFGGWNVIQIGVTEDMLAVVSAHPGVFGEATR